MYPPTTVSCYLKSNIPLTWLETERDTLCPHTRMCHFTFTLFFSSKALIYWLINQSLKRELWQSSPAWAHIFHEERWAPLDGTWQQGHNTDVNHICTEGKCLPFLCMSGEIKVRLSCPKNPQHRFFDQEKVARPPVKSFCPQSEKRKKILTVGEALYVSIVWFVS